MFYINLYVSLYIQSRSGRDEEAGAASTLADPMYITMMYVYLSLSLYIYIYIHMYTTTTTNNNNNNNTNNDNMC